MDRVDWENKMFRFRATNMFMALAVATDVLSTRTGRVTFVTGETL